jgi:hypothetical protein
VAIRTPRHSDGRAPTEVDAQPFAALWFAKSPSALHLFAAYSDFWRWTAASWRVINANGLLSPSYAVGRGAP